MCAEQKSFSNAEKCQSTCSLCDRIKVKSLWQTLCNKWHLIFHKPSKMCNIQASIEEEYKSLVLADFTYRLLLLRFLCFEMKQMKFEQSAENVFVHFNIYIVFFFFRVDPISLLSIMCLTCVRISHQHSIH